MHEEEIKLTETLQSSESAEEKEGDSDEKISANLFLTGTMASKVVEVIAEES